MKKNKLIINVLLILCSTKISTNPANSINEELENKYPSLLSPFK